MPNVAYTDLTRFARAVFESAGVSPGNAAIWAETLDLSQPARCR